MDKTLKGMICVIMMCVILYLLWKLLSWLAKYLFAIKRTYKPKTRISLQYFIDNSHKLTEDELNTFARTNFITVQSNNPPFVRVKLAENSMVRLDYIDEYLIRDPNISSLQGMYIYDLPDSILDILASDESHD